MWHYDYYAFMQCVIAFQLYCSSIYGDGDNKVGRLLRLTLPETFSCSEVIIPMGGDGNFQLCSAASYRGGEPQLWVRKGPKET